MKYHRQILPCLCLLSLFLGNCITKAEAQSLSNLSNTSCVSVNEVQDYGHDRHPDGSPSLALQGAIQTQTADAAYQRGFSPVEILFQNPELPNGCEATSLAMVLTSAGWPVSPVSFYENSMSHSGFSYREGQRFGPSPEEVYVGDAADPAGGWYCFELPVMEAGNRWIEANGGGGHMQRISGISPSELDDYARDGVPVIVWVTLQYGAPTYAESFRWVLPDGTLYTPYSNLHCVVVAGEDDGQYRIADPIYGWQKIEKSRFWASFDAMGRRAVTVI